MTKKKARWWLESLVRNHGGSLHREALAVIFAEPVESRPTVQAKCPVQQAKHETAKPDLCKGMPHGSCKGETWCNKTNVCFRPALPHRAVGRDVGGNSPPTN